jgi:phosphoribosyl 1,2-cyclic phosphate phosphodiesterase
MLKHKIKKLDEVLVTHSHLDHISSLTELRELENMELKIPAPLLDIIDEKIEMITYLKVRNPGLKISKFKPHKIGNVFIDSIKVNHKKDFSDRNGPCYGYLFVENRFRFAYIPDFNEILEPEKVKNLDLLICDGATYEQKWGHVGIEGGLKLFAKIKPKMMLFTHISHSSPEHRELEKLVGKHGNIKIAYDGMIIKT